MQNKVQLTFTDLEYALLKMRYAEYVKRCEGKNKTINMWMKDIIITEAKI